MTTVFSDDEYKKATVKVSWGSSFGTIFVYLISPVIISFFGWKYVFIFSAICGGLMILVWQKYCPDINIEKRSSNLSDCVKKSLLDAIVEHSEIEFWNTSSISDMLTRYPTIECFANEYVVSTELWDILFGLGGYSAEDITDTDREYLETMLCAAIAERLYGIEARYYINICRSDYMAQQAISIATSSRKF
jgi:MFS family permease